MTFLVVLKNIWVGFLTVILWIFEGLGKLVRAAANSASAGEQQGGDRLHPQALHRRVDRSERADQAWDYDNRPVEWEQGYQDYQYRDYDPPQYPYRRGVNSSQHNSHRSSTHTYTSREYQPHSSGYSPQVHSMLPGSSRENAKRPKLERKYSKITDQYRSLSEVTEALAEAGLESSNLIVGIDFTKSNEWTGKHSFNGKSLHHINDTPNPYEQAITIIGKSLSAFDEDNLIPCFGFGDATTHDQDVFCFNPDEKPCHGFEEALLRYREIIPKLRLSGPTSFAPIIEMAMTIVEQSGGQYHVLVIIADGQVTRSVDTEFGSLSPQEQKTVDAIVNASEFPLSIILVGVGDGPWDMMKEFDDNIPARSFDNFQFVNFTDIMAKNTIAAKRETEFALAALMEIPSQYKATLELGILGQAKGSPERVPLPPPYGTYSTSSSFNERTLGAQSSFNRRTLGASSSFNDRTLRATAEPQTVISHLDEYSSTDGNQTRSQSTSTDAQTCPVCLTKSRDMAFGCGHQTCHECGEDLDTCPICRRTIDIRIKLF